MFNKDYDNIYPLLNYKTFILYLFTVTGVTLKYGWTRPSKPPLGVSGVMVNWVNTALQYQLGHSK